MSTPYKNFFKNSKQNIETRIVLNENSKNYIHDLEVIFYFFFAFQITVITRTQIFYQIQSKVKANYHPIN